jgi:antitoxin component YwqK of YwqJK toxin-antitoxin module
MKIESLVIEHYDNGKVSLKGQRNSKGQEEGICEGFYENGNIHWRTSFKEGKKDGIDEWFYENGNIRMRTPYKEDKPDGIEEIFYENGNITLTLLWKDGKLIEITEH